MTANLNEDTSGSKCQLNSMVQETGRRAEKERRKTDRNRRSRRVGGGKDTK